MYFNNLTDRQKKSIAYLKREGNQMCFLMLSEN